MGLILMTCASCSVASKAGIDHSGYKKHATDWQAASQITGIPMSAIHRYLKAEDPIEVTETVFISNNFQGKGVYLVNLGPDCDQVEGRPPAFRIREGSGIIVRDLHFRGTGHDGFHVRPRRNRLHKAPGTVSHVTFESCIFTACEDAVTLGAGTSNISFKNCIFVANPDGRYRDKLVQLTHADETRFTNCYFSATRNGVEFKSGAKIYAEKCMFDHCSTAWRVNTADQYGEIVPNQETQLDSWNCIYRRAKQAFFLEGTASGVSTGDVFEGSRKAVTRKGATMYFRDKGEERPG